MQESRDKKNLISGAFIFIFGLAYYLGSFAIQKYRGYGDVGVTARTFPQILGVLLMFLSAVQLLQARRTISEEGEGDEDISLKEKITNLGIALGITVTYLGLLQFLGFILSTIGYLFCQFLLLTPKEKRNYKVIVILSIGCPIILYFIFVWGLSLILPQGILG